MNRKIAAIFAADVAGYSKLPPVSRQAEALVPESIPFVTDRQRNNVRSEYMPAPDHKALAISAGPIGFTSGQADDETAKAVALDICQKRADALPQRRKCELYALGNTVVYAGGRLPMPPVPWVRHDRPRPSRWLSMTSR